MGMLKEFKEFALKGNVLDLAVGVVIGGAFGKIVKALTDDLIMPVVGRLMPGGNWRTYSLKGLLLGDLLGVVIDFIIVAFVLFLIVKGINRLRGPGPAAVTRECPACLEIVPKKATRCKACTSELPVAA